MFFGETRSSSFVQRLLILAVCVSFGSKNLAHATFLFFKKRQTQTFSVSREKALDTPHTKNTMLLRDLVPVGLKALPTTGKLKKQPLLLCAFISGDDDNNNNNNSICSEFDVPTCLGFPRNLLGSTTHASANHVDIPTTAAHHQSQLNVVVVENANVLAVSSLSSCGDDDRVICAVVRRRGDASSLISSFPFTFPVKIVFRAVLDFVKSLIMGKRIVVGSVFTVLVILCLLLGLAGVAHCSSLRASLIMVEWFVDGFNASTDLLLIRFGNVSSSCAFVEKRVPIFSRALPIKS